MTLLATYFPITDPTLIFFVVLLIILFAPIVMSKLRIPHIIGMVLAGILIGKYGFNILERDNSFELFGRVGLYYIMFLAGLEMDMEGVKKHSRQFIIFGLLTCFVPLILTYIMAMTLLDYSGTASFLLGCIMASNTLIAYPIVGRYGLQRHPSVTLSVGSSMISLFMALVMLAALAGSYEENNSWLFWPLFILKFAVFCLVSIIFIPKLTRYFLRRYSDAVMQYIFVLAIMFLSAAFTAHQYPHHLCGSRDVVDRVPHRVLRHLWQGPCRLCLQPAVPTDTGRRSHDVRPDLCSCCRCHRHGDGGHATGGGAWRVPDQ